MAALDTGATFTCLDPELAEEIGLDPAAGERVSMSTRWGSQDGALLSEVPLTLLAEEGESLRVDATVFVPTAGDSPLRGRTFLGYIGFLERIRFALDPQRNDFYFGGAV